MGLVNRWEDCFKVCNPVAVSYELTNSLVALTPHEELVQSLCVVLTTCLICVFHVEQDLRNVWAYLSRNNVER